MRSSGTGSLVRSSCLTDAAVQCPLTHVVHWLQIRPGAMGQVFWVESNVNNTQSPDRGAIYVTDIRTDKDSQDNAAVSGFFIWKGTDLANRSLDPNGVLCAELRCSNVKLHPAQTRIHTPRDSSQPPLRRSPTAMQCACARCCPGLPDLPDPPAPPARLPA